MDKILLDYPIPSIRINKLYYDSDWKYEYKITNESKIPIEKILKEELYINEDISKLILVPKSKLIKSSINLSIKSIDCIHNLLEKQKKADTDFREQFFQNRHVDLKDMNVYEVENKTHIPIFQTIVKVFEKSANKTRFLVSSMRRKP